MKLVPGLKIAETIRQNIKEEIAARRLNLKMAIIYAGENSASDIYVEKKLAWSKEAGIETELIKLPETDEQELLAVIDRLNKERETTGYIVQLPLPSNINTTKILSAISPDKDIDGLNPLSMGRLFHSDPNTFISATALAVLQTLSYIAKYKDDGMYTAEEMTANEDNILNDFLKGKNILIINHSLLVGKPLSAIFLKYNATLTIAHKYTPQDRLNALLEENDIIISATGRPGIITKEQVHDGQIVIDVGINKSALKVNGDVDPAGMEDQDIWLTPVPNGVGPLTVAMLMKNLLKAGEK